ncbi:O-antigen ligase family protein [Bacillus mobilis]|uniref:O-antigen ligase family protein n=1 Tax=Bacillus mobilis TaxID=2026190 RepID=UPI003312ED2C|nr:hypothetical protein [Bacillus mobilis]
MIRVGSIYQIIFFGYIFILGVYSPIKYHVLDIYGMQITLSDFSLFLILFISLPLVFYKGKRAVSKKVFILFNILFIWAAITLINFSKGIDLWYIIYPLFLTWLYITVPFIISKITNGSFGDWHKIITNFSNILTVVYCFYLINYFQELSFNPVARLDGSFGGAAVIHFSMIPVLAVHFTNLQIRKRKLIPFFGILITMSSIIATGSRSALLSLGLLCAYFLFRNFSIKKFLISLIAISLSAWIILQFISTDRYGSFEDKARAMNMKTSLDMANHSVSSIFFGNGYGSVWPWYAYEHGAAFWNTADQLVSTPYGYVLPNPHSVFLEVYTELGLIGTSIFALIIFIILKQFLKSRKEDPLKANILAAIICTIPCMFLDLYIFKNFEVSMFWSFFLFGALTANSNKNTLTASD